MGHPATRLRRGRSTFEQDVRRGLRAPLKSVPSKYLYDDRGSRLFEEICRLDEYYLTRTELEILRVHRAEMSEWIGPGARVIEPGAGSGVKTELLLDGLMAPAGYVPIELSEGALSAAVHRLARRFPGLDIHPLVADFTDPIELPEGRNLVFFPGSTIGNFEPDEAIRLLGAMGSIAGPRGAILVGVDFKKDARILERAYDDARGVTAEFNLNLLRRINRELGGDFRRDRFRHAAPYDHARGRIEMRLVSGSEQQVRVGEDVFDFGRGETILTELCHKYEPREFEGLCRSAGLEVARRWTDPAGWYGLFLCMS
jgi:L-histidine Nalpha-methyltransferase